MTISPSSRHWSKKNQVFQLILPTHIEKQTKMHGYGVYKALLICKIGDPESGVKALNTHYLLSVSRRLGIPILRQK